jgi:hypothetical protein
MLLPGGLQGLHSSQAFLEKNSHDSGQLLDLQDRVVIHIIALNACRDWLIELRDESWVIQT